MEFVESRIVKRKKAALVIGFFTLLGFAVTNRVSSYWFGMPSYLLLALSVGGIFYLFFEYKWLRVLTSNFIFFKSIKDLKKKLVRGKYFLGIGIDFNLYYKKMRRPEIAILRRDMLKTLSLRREKIYLGRETQVQQNFHKYITGTSGSGKTRHIEVLIIQGLINNASQIIFDPKGDVQLREKIKSFCSCYNINFHQIIATDSQNSDSYNPLYQVSDKPVEMERILSSTIPYEKGTGNLFYRAQASGEAISDGNALVSAGIRPTIQSFYYIFEDRFKDLVEEMHVEDYYRNTYSSKYIPCHNGEKKDSKHEHNSYEQKMNCDRRHKFIPYQKVFESLIDNEEVIEMMRSIRKDNITRMRNTANLRVALQRICSAGDLRKILNSQNPKVVMTNIFKRVPQVLYVCIPVDKLEDIASDVLKMMLCDIQCSIANLREEKEVCPADIWIDEFQACLIPGFIDLLKTARDVGVSINMITQSNASISAMIGENSTEDLINNCDTHIHFAQSSDSQATGVSKLIGNTMQQRSARMMRHPTKGKSDDVLFYSKVQREESDYVVQPEIPKALIPGEAVIKANKKVYFARTPLLIQKEITNDG